MTLFDRLTLHLDALPHDGAWNMAVDQAWLEISDVPVLRVYDWDAATVTIGYAQNLAKLGEALPGWPVMRRWTGGGVVLHEKDETYSVIVPGAHPWAETRPLDSYRLIHAALAEALVAAGFNGCRLAGPDDLIENPFCFVAPALHDVVRGKVKIAGAGQRRGKLGLLHQGSVQQVVVKSDFWRGWAAVLAEEVMLVNELPPQIAARAQELVEKRYSLPQWLAEREDLL
ncbi:biotin/lipoate A/B protein ligase family protein [Prosthecobacter sp.]|jgi:lipoate-protein ligase A|uniref:biotin/lipoate A/B protein ligase family protein n=1 Tax=Prosthecobacter sp. TaxID=1965333 RepID=UPI00378307B5